MLMAEEYVRDPLRYPLRPVPDLPLVREAFDRRDGVLLDRGPSRMNDVLPAKFTFVAVECWLLGQGMTRLTFGAETEMSRLLDVKGHTGGLVSADLNGRNLHPWLAPLPIPMALRNSAAIVRDRVQELSDGKTRIGLFDIWHSINTHERFAHAVPAAGPVSSLWSPDATTPPWGRRRQRR